jgi:hypothetical protein
MRTSIVQVLMCPYVVSKLDGACILERGFHAVSCGLLNIPLELRDGMDLICCRWNAWLNVLRDG